jgi:hypothetical protein
MQCAYISQQCEGQLYSFYAALVPRCPTVYRKSSIYTLLLLQVLNTVPHPLLLRRVFQVLVCYCFHLALLPVLSETNALQPLVDVEAEVVRVFVILAPSPAKPPLCLLRLCREPKQSLPYIVLERLLFRVPSADRDEALDERLQVTHARTPDLYSLIFHFLNGVVGPQLAADELPRSNRDGFEEADRRRRRERSPGDSRPDIVIEG